MKNICIFASYITLCLSLFSCDSGDIYPEEESSDSGVVCQAKLSFSSIASWPTVYNVVLAAYGENGEYAIVSKGISKPIVNDTFTTSLPSISKACDYVAISLLNKGKREVYRFSSHRITDRERDESLINFEALGINMLAYERVQAQVFSNCANCHGASSSAAAGLFLTPERSYSAIVNVQSKKEPSKKIVESGLPTESFILDVLEGRAELHYNHANVSFNSEAEDLNLLKDWIRNLKQ